MHSCATLQSVLLAQSLKLRPYAPFLSTEQCPFTSLETVVFAQPILDAISVAVLLSANPAAISTLSSMPRWLLSFSFFIFPSSPFPEAGRKHGYGLMETEGRQRRLQS